MPGVSFLKLMLMIEHIKMRQILYLDIWSMLLSVKVPYTSISGHLFQNFEDPVLVQTPCYRKKISYYSLALAVN